MLFDSVLLLELLNHDFYCWVRLPSLDEVIDPLGDLSLHGVYEGLVFLVEAVLLSDLLLVVLCQGKVLLGNLVDLSLQLSQLRVFLQTGHALCGGLLAFVLLVGGFLKASDDCGLMLELLL